MAGRGTGGGANNRMGARVATDHHSDVTVDQRLVRIRAPSLLIPLLHYLTVRRLSRKHRGGATRKCVNAVIAIRVAVRFRFCAAARAVKIRAVNVVTGACGGLVAG